MSERVVHLNGRFVPEDRAAVSIFDTALMFGDMAFEVTRTFRHKPFRLRHHLERLYASLRLIETDPGLSIDEMERLTQETLERNLATEPTDVDWQIIHDVSRGPLDLYASTFRDGVCPTVIISCWPLVVHMGQFAKSYDSGLNLVIAPQQALPAHLLDPKAKTRSRLHYRMALLQAQRMGENAWPLMADPDGFLAEGPGWNFFLVRDGTLYTSERRNILAGVSRALTIELAGELGIPVRETNLGRYEVLQADELIVTATTYCLVHASTFEGTPVGDGTPGPVFRKLTEAWKKRAGLDFIAQARSYAPRVSDWEAQQRQQPSQ